MLKLIGLITIIIMLPFAISLQTIENDKPNGWNVQLTGNESIMYTTKIINNTLNIIPKYDTKTFKVPSCTLKKDWTPPKRCKDIECWTTIDSYDCKDVTYTYPDNLPLSTKNKTLGLIYPDTKVTINKSSEISGKNINESKGIYYIDLKDEKYLKFGTSSITITGDTSYNSTDTNITQETGYSHLNVSDNRLMLYFQFDRNSTTFHDMTSHTDGTCSGSNCPTFTDKSKYGNAYTFDGNSDYISVANSPSVNLTANRLTLSAWVNCTNKADAQIIIAKPVAEGTHSSPYFAYSIHLLPGGYPRFWLANPDTYWDYAQSSVACNLGQWNHILGVYDGSTVKLYLNGVERASAVRTGAIKSYNTNLKIGTNGGLTELFNNSIDEVRIYNDSLSLAEINLLYTAQLNTFYPTGEQLFKDINLGNNTVNVSLGYANLLNTSVRLKFNNLAYVTLNSSGSISDYDVSTITDKTKVNMTLQYLSNSTLGNSSFYSPLIYGNITITSFSPSAVTTCTYSGSGNWVINGYENCTITTSINLLNNNISIIGGGIFTVNGGNITNYKVRTFRGSSITNKIIIRILRGRF